ncbi:uncharacterized protein LOC113326387 [Papaver somniferum]|uniref:uncharacterized protein LOC113326387 n=1 Tax=Papaver somniferum TaxID=3469 RepID=UPI000E6F9E42|nr:uncharacterized protein LOC113326387 [Papaver somniferum]
MTDWFIRQLWYDDNFGWTYIPSNGNSGGILTIWDSSRFDKLDERLGFNNITVSLSNRINGFQWELSNVYSPCEHERRTEFWQDMYEVRNWRTGPICITGDMNAVRASEERNRGVGDSRNTAMLNNFILEFELIDQPLIGGSFTWSINQPYFKFDRVWIEHKDFAQNVKLWWETLTYSGSASTRFFLKFRNLKHLIKPWKKQEYGHICRDKNELTTRIHELNILEETFTLLHNEMEERTSCKLKLRNIEAVEAKKRHLRSKQNDFRWGDSNTRYFHSMASAGKKRNTIAKIQFADDTLIFIDATVEEVRRIFIILAVFETITGLKLNLDKSTMISVGAGGVIEDLSR